MDSQEIVQLSAIELSQKIHKRQVSCVEVMAAYLKQIKHFNPTVNAIVGILDDKVLLEEAEKADIELASGHSRGWLHGFPMAVKDKANIVRGLVGTSGLTVNKGKVGTSDSIFVHRIRQQGAIFIGRTNMPELALGSHSYNKVYGTTCNAFNPKLAGGGSSGGAAVALALRMLPVADGSDTMGSLRNPAAWNNVYGFLPTVGLIPASGSNDLFFSPLSTDGPMARNIEDLSHLLTTMAGYDSSCPLSFDYVRSDNEFFAQETPKVAWLGDLGGHLAMDPDLLNESYQACHKLQAANVASVADLSIDFDLNTLWDAWCTIRSWAISNGLNALSPDQQDQLNAQAKYELDSAEGLSAKDIYRAETVRSSWYRKILEYFDKFDFLVLPSTQTWPFPKEWTWPTSINGRAMDTYHRWMEVTLYASFAGLPAISVPVGFGANGLAFGLQVIAPRKQDERLLSFVKLMEPLYLDSRRSSVSL